MSRDRFKDIFSAQRYSDQPVERPPHLSSEQHRWMLVDDHINCFNKNRARNYYPSHYICADESMSRWYGVGGQWINAGLPQYIAMDRKPENGCEIQNAADGVSGIMMRLKLVKTMEAHVADRESENESGLLHGTNVLLDLVKPWWNKQQTRTVSADSYFASVQACDELMKKNLRFIGIVKTATKGFCMKRLSELELVERGDWKGYYTYTLWEPTLERRGNSHSYGWTETVGILSLTILL